ncbi:PREDICTED: neuronal acetylcholine receptor subunit alpha-10-like [Branchiostoma belcheri]|uniref:Neuronal acetylcholine receptor subunit alpha-10-like n=1 Tax=Branchiostoma belcheri TaxID=7741 RepID=A0A6P5A1N6_BRABE|nr:PREDICTED: neuronal acetylcholine receptor subunit alpha-10-like [Branchiostoma belcheri]
MKTSLVVFVAVAVMLHVTSGSEVQSSEERLIMDLLEGYNTDRRPVRNMSDPVNVTIDVAVAEYLHLDDRNHMLTVNLWMRLFWTDQFLQWDPSKYDGVDLLRVQSSNIWNPDIVLYNSVFEEGYGETPDFKATIRPDGSVAFLYPFTFKAACRVNIVYFPEDRQVCPLKFGSWSYDGLKLDLVNRFSKGDITNLASSEEWIVTDLMAERHVHYYNCCPEPYPDVTFTLVMNRMPFYYQYYIFVPASVLMLISLLGFLTPPESGERMTMVLTALLANTVNMEVVAGQLPKTSSYVPIIGKYFGAVLFVNALAIAMNVVILCLHFGSFRAQPPPAWLKRLLRIDTPAAWADWFFWRCFRRRTISFPTDASGVILNSCTMTDMIGDTVLSGRKGRLTRPYSTSAIESTSLKKPLSNNSAVDPVLRAKMDIIVNNLKAARISREEKKRHDEAMYAWREVASRIDRIFFAIFTVVMIVVNAAVFRQI